MHSAAKTIAWISIMGMGYRSQCDIRTTTGYRWRTISNWSLVSNTQKINFENIHKWLKSFFSFNLSSFQNKYSLKTSFYIYQNFRFSHDSHTYKVVHTDHILHLVCIWGWHFLAPHTHVLCMGSGSATGVFPATRLVHYLLKYFFKFQLWYWIQLYTTKYSNLILIFRY